MPSLASRQVFDLAIHAEDQATAAIQRAAELLPESDRMIMVAATTAMLAARLLFALELSRGKETAAAMWDQALVAARKGMAVDCGAAGAAVQ